MLHSIDLKQQRAHFVDVAKGILDKAENEKRSLTPAEDKEHRSLCDQIHSLDGDILKFEKIEAQEAEAALASWNGGNGHAGNGNTRSGLRFLTSERYGDNHYRQGQALRADQSFSSYMRTVRGLEPQDELTFGDFARSLITGPRTEAERRALAESGDATGGALVPDYLAANFIDRLRAAMPTVGFGARTIELTSDNLSIARTVSDPTVAWRNENAPVAESDPVFERVLMTPRSLAAHCKVSVELFEDSQNISSALEAAFVGAAAAEVERVALAGTGSAPQPRGIRSTTNVNEVSQGDNGAQLMSWDPVISLIQAVWEDNEQVISGMIMSPRTMGTILKLKEATTNAPLQMPPVIRDIPQAQTSAVINTETQGSSNVASTLYLGNWSRLFYGFRNQARIKVYPQPFATNLQIMFMVDLRMDVALEHPESFGRLIGIVP